MTPSEAVAKIIQVAIDEIGYLEKASRSQLDSKTANPGKNNWTKYAEYLDSLGLIYNGKKNGYNWCDIFVDWCFIHTFGYPLGQNLLYQEDRGLGAGCTYSARYYKNHNAFFTSPKPGDQIFYSKDGGKTSYHTGLVVKVDSTYVYTVEGNTSSDPGVVANGGSVNDKRYKLNYKYIMGYGRPNWELFEDTKTEVPTTPEGGTTVKRYERLSQIPDNWGNGEPRSIINTLMDAKIICGDGSDKTGNNDIIDLSWDMIRTIVFFYRAGAFDKGLKAAGLPTVYEE